jgi:hypothetical protein
MNDQTRVQAPIALALIQRSDDRYLTLAGLGKVDLPAAKPPPGIRLESELAKKLALLGVNGARLVFRWGAIAAWSGNIRPVHVFEAQGWSGTPSEECLWSTPAEICRGQRTELYKRLFAKLGAGGEARFESASPLIVEAGTERKPPESKCPKCGSSLRLRNRKPGEEPRWDCRGCSSSWGLSGSELQRVPPLG